MMWGVWCALLGHLHIVHGVAGYESHKTPGNQLEWK